MMNLEQARKRYLPMSETMFYILLSLKQERHGYAIMRMLKNWTDVRIELGAGLSIPVWVNWKATA